MSKCEKCKSLKKKRLIISCTVNEKGEHHSFDDRPSLVYKDNFRMWHKNGLNHRENAPAIIWPNGKEFWYYEGRSEICISERLSKNTFRYFDDIGTILCHIEFNVYLGLIGDKKYYIRTQ